MLHISIEQLIVLMEDSLLLESLYSVSFSGVNGLQLFAAQYKGALRKYITDDTVTIFIKYIA